MNLKLCSFGQYKAKIKGHPEEIMEKLGIKYEYAISQSIGDQWWFYNCKFNCKLPKFITELKEIK